MNTELFDLTVAFNEAWCVSQNVTMVTGKAAFEANANAVVRRSLAESMFHVGDTIKLSDNIEDKKRWYSLPITKGGSPVFRALCEVTSIDGTVAARELFHGTLVKSVQNRDTKQFVSVTGSLTEFLHGCILQNDAWTKLLGKTLKITAATEVPILKRGWSGQPDRLVTTTVYSIDVVA